MYGAFRVRYQISIESPSVILVLICISEKLYVYTAKYDYLNCLFHSTGSILTRNIITSELECLTHALDGPAKKLL